MVTTVTMDLTVTLTKIQFFYGMSCRWVNSTSGVLLSVPLSITLVNDQLDAQFFYFIIRLLQSSTCFEQLRAYHQEVKQFFYFIIRLLQSSTCFEQRRAHHQEVK